MTVMIADDNIEQAKQLAYMLTKEKDIEVIDISCNGQIALERYIALNPDILILDLDMPIMNGIDLLEQLTTYDNKKNIIIVSGSLFHRGQISDVSKIEMIYQKPYDIQKIIDSIRRIKFSKPTVEIKLDNILKNLQFDSCAKGTILLKSAILISYDNPQFNLDSIIQKVQIIHKEKNPKTVHSLIDKQLDFSALLALTMCFSTTAITSTAMAADCMPTATNTSALTTDDDGWILLDGPTTLDGTSLVPYSGVETWTYTGYYERHVGDFTMYGYNLTPVKTIARDDTNNRYLAIFTNFSCSSSSILTVQIRDYPSGSVLAQNSSNATTSGSVTVEAGGVSGKQVQIYFKVTDAYGNYNGNRACNISYGYTLRGISIF